MIIYARWACLGFLLLPPCLGAAESAARVAVIKDGRAWKLTVNDRPFLVRGVTWSYTPIGRNHEYDLWSKPAAFIRKVVDRDGRLMKDMGVNAVRVQPNVPPEWIAYLHKHYGLYAVVNDYVGRYGVTIDGKLRTPTDYADPAVRQHLKTRAADMVKRYRHTPGVLLFAFGNENNYGLADKAAPTEPNPSADQVRSRADSLYSLMEEIFQAAKALDPHHPVVLVNGELHYLDVIARTCKSLDILGGNVYRGRSARDLFDKVRADTGLPFLFTEMGADAFNTRTEREDPFLQASIYKAQWREIYEHCRGPEANCLGGLVFEWCDEWWKAGQSYGLDRHDEIASWTSPHYDDFVPGRHNMNEEWWGICRLSPARIDGVHILEPRTGYYVLQAIWKLDPFQADATQLAEHFARIEAEPFKPVKASLPLVVYDESDARGPQPFFSSGWIGNIQGVKMDPAYKTNPHGGQTCLRIDFTRSDGWAGVVWQNPPGDWGDSPGGWDLSAAKALSFWARGDTGTEVVEFKVGLADSKKPYPDSGTATLGKVTLPREWTKFTLPLKRVDLRCIRSGFVWVVEGQKPVTFYLDDIRYD